MDFARTTGAFRGGATGTLYGFGDDGAPTQALIDGAHITNTSQKAPYGTQHPSGDALKVEDGFFRKHGKDMYIYVQDYYPDWSYNGGRRPGDSRTYNQADGTYVSTPNGIWDYLEVVEFVTEAVATSSARPEGLRLHPVQRARRRQLVRQLGHHEGHLPGRLEGHLRQDPEGLRPTRPRPRPDRRPR